MDGGNARRADHAANYALWALPPTQQPGYLLGTFALDGLKVGEWTMFEIDKLEHLHQQQVAVLCQQGFQSEVAQARGAWLSGGESLRHALRVHVDDMRQQLALGGVELLHGHGHGLSGLVVHYFSSHAEKSFLDGHYVFVGVCLHYF